MDSLFSWLNSTLSPWVYAPFALLIWIASLYLLKNLFYKKMKSLFPPGSFWITNIILKAAQFPSNLLIVGSGFYLLQLLIPLEAKNQHSLVVLSQASVIVSTILFLDRAVQEFINSYKGSELAFISKGILLGLLRGTVIGFGLLIFLDLIGISITPVLASLGIGSLAIGLALQDTLANFFAGIYITIDKPVREGDFIKLESGEEGYVVEVGWRSTRIQMLPNNILIIPNQKIISTIITNYYLPSPELAVLVEVGVHYQSDLNQVERVTVEVARQIMKTVPGAVPNFEPFIRYHTFGESSINFTVILRGKQFVDQYLIKHEFVKALAERYQKEKITIPYPIRTLDVPKNTLDALQS